MKRVARARAGPQNERVRWLRVAVLIAPCATGAAACGLASNGTAGAGGDSGAGRLDAGAIGAEGGSGDGTVGDGSPTTADGALDAAPPPDTGPPCTPAGTTACFAVPPGWSFVARATPEGTTCPEGFSQPTEWLEGPSSNPNECTCSACDVTDPPSCTGGPVSVFYDFAGNQTCGLIGIPGQNGNNPAGACLRDMFVGNYPTNDDDKYTPSPPQGGACSAPATPQPANVTYAETAYTCSPDGSQAAGCSAGVCAPSLPPPFAPCLEQSGDVPCPGAPFTVKHLAGTSVSITCSDCGCTVSATCSGTMTLFPDTACAGIGVPIPADGACHLAGTDGGVYQSYRFVGATDDVACVLGAPPPPPPPPTLTGTATICCAQ
jgi:hypothetical protein